MERVYCLKVENYGWSFEIYNFKQSSLFKQDVC